jgi:hypothetical protein
VITAESRPYGAGTESVERRSEHRLGRATPAAEAPCAESGRARNGGAIAGCVTEPATARSLRRRHFGAGGARGCMRRAWSDPAVEPPRFTAGRSGCDGGRRMGARRCREPRPCRRPTATAGTRSAAQRVLRQSRWAQGHTTCERRRRECVTGIHGQTGGAPPACIALRSNAGRVKRRDWRPARAG